MKQSLHLPILLAGLLAAAGVQAQTAPAAASTDLPPKAGEASTQTQGVPNAKTTNAPVSEAPAPAPGAVGREVQSMGAAAATSPVPPKAGEASTVARSNPNIEPEKPMARSRAEVVAELMGRPAAFEAWRRELLAAGKSRASS